MINRKSDEMRIQVHVARVNRMKTSFNMKQKKRPHVGNR